MNIEKLFTDCRLEPIKKSAYEAIDELKKDIVMTFLKENGVSANEKITNKLEPLVNIMSTDETEEYIKEYLSELLNESIKQGTWINSYLKIDTEKYLYDMVLSASWQIYAIKNNDEFEYFVFEQERFEDEADYIVGTYCE